MTAASAAGHSIPPFYIGANLASTPEDAKDLVFQALPPHSNEKYYPTWYGTHHTVAASVGKFPFRPHDNYHHAQHRSAATKTPPDPLPDLITSLTTPLPAITLKSKPFDLEALLQQVKKNKAEMDRWVWPTPMPTTPTHSEPPLHQQITNYIPADTPPRKLDLEAILPQLNNNTVEMD